MSEANDNSLNDETCAADPQSATVKPASGISFQADPRQIEIAGYSVGEELGRGGMGSVLSAEDGRLDRHVALKVMLAADAGRAARIRFEREARVLARLEHPNIVPIHDVGKTADDRPFYTMKLVRGRTLQSIIRALREQEAAAVKAYTLDDLLVIFRKVCDAVAFAHDRGVVHRDLKPDNVMVGEFGEVLVMDWGLAKLHDAEDPAEDVKADVKSNASDNPTTDDNLSPDTAVTLDGQILGTPQYMAPEQATGAVGKVDHRADVYSLGAILQAILTLEAPFSGSTAAEIIERVGKGERIQVTPGKNERAVHCPRNLISQTLAAVINQAMAVDPDRRYPTVADLAKDVTAFQQGYSSSAEQASIWRRYALFIERNKFLFLAITLGLTAACYTYLFSLLHLRAEQRRMADAAREYLGSASDVRALHWHLLSTVPKSPVEPVPAGWQDLFREVTETHGTNAEYKRWFYNRRAMWTPAGGASILPLIRPDPQRPWKLRLQVRKFFHAGALAFQMPFAERSLTFSLDARRGTNRFSGFAPDEDGRPGGDSWVRGNRVPRNGKRHLFELAYEPGPDGTIGVSAALNGKTFLKWTGPGAEIMENNFWKFEDPSQLWLCGNGGNWMIESIRFHQASPNAE